MGTIITSITDTWVNVKEKFSLAEGTSYMVDNVGGAKVYMQESITTPVNSIGHLISIGENRVIVIGSDSVWLRSKSSTANIGLTKQNRDVGIVPSSFASSTSSGTTTPIKQGQLNKIRLRPQIINEHAESSRNIIAAVSSENIVGQIFKASQDNINGIDLTLESAAITSFDDFESYANSTALQAAWVYSDSGEEAVLNNTITEPAASTKSMQLDCGGNTGEEWEITIASTDFTGVTGSTRLYANKEYKDVKLRFFFRDSSGNTASAPMVQLNKDIWNKIEISAAQLGEDGAWVTDRSDIVGVGFRVEKERGGGIIIVDTLTYSPPPGSIAIKIFDMGTTLPESGVDGLNDGTPYEKIGDLGISGSQEALVNLNLKGGFRSYHLDTFVCGAALEIPTNELLTPGNYYAITLNYVDTDVSVYGPNAAWDNYYKSGYSFTTPDEVSVVTATGTDEDIMFIIYSIQDVYLSGFLNIANALPNGNSKASLYIEDKNMIRTHAIVTGIKPPQVVDRTLSIPSLLPKGGKVEAEYNDDFTDSVSEISLVIIYFFEKQEVNG